MRNQGVIRVLKLIVGAAFAVVLGLVAPVVGAASPLATPAATTVDLNLRAGPGTGYEVLAVMPAGSRVSALLEEPQNGYVQVLYGEQAGWAAAAYLAVGNGGDDPSGGDTAPGSATVTANLNLRSGPGTGHPVVLVVPAGSAVTVTGEGETGYVPVTYQGVYGWVSQFYLIRADLVA